MVMFLILLIQFRLKIVFIFDSKNESAIINRNIVENLEKDFRDIYEGKRTIVFTVLLQYMMSIILLFWKKKEKELKKIKEENL